MRSLQRPDSVKCNKSLKTNNINISVVKVLNQIRCGGETLYLNMSVLPKSPEADAEPARLRRTAESLHSGRPGGSVQRAANQRLPNRLRTGTRAAWAAAMIVKPR